MPPAYTSGETSTRGKKKRAANDSASKNKEETDTPKAYIQKAPVPFDEYEYDSSDEEDLRNTIGNIPIKWYDDEDHIGYSKDGDKIAKPKKKGEIDQFLEKMEDPDYWRKVFDRQAGTDVILTDEQVEKLQNIASGKYPTIGYNPYEPFYDIFSSQKSIHPIDNRPESKARFVPSKDEMKMVSRFLYAIKMGWAKGPKAKKEDKKMYDIWASEDDGHKTKSALARMRVHMPAPKVALPLHSESYNPPAEYLLDDDEKKKWAEAEPEDRRLTYIPEKFDALRKVPQFARFINERYERCLDLYLAPRQRKMKIQCDPKDLLPDLPNPNDLKPFPTTLAFYMQGHEGQVRALSVEPEKGELLVSGGEDGTVRVWSIGSGRCIKTFKVSGPVTSIDFCPISSRSMVAVAYEGHEVAIINIGCGDKVVIGETEKFMKEVEVGESEGKVQWRRVNERIILKCPNEIRKVVWHSKGDYLATVSAVDIAQSVYIHQLSKAKSQCPFTKRKGYVQCVAFHPTQARLYVATKIHVRVYDLARCMLVKKCITGIKHIAAMCTDNTGENVFIGGLDRAFAWMDMELSNKPWKKFRHQESAIRGVAYHKKYPLLATAGDDGSAMVYYARIYVDSYRDNEVYPVKKLRAHKSVNDLCMLDCVWHPTQPWLITAGADGTIALFSY